MPKTKLIIIDIEKGKIVKESRTIVIKNTKFYMHDIFKIKEKYFINYLEKMLVFDSRSGKFLSGFQIFFKGIKLKGYKQNYRIYPQRYGMNRPENSMIKDGRIFIIGSGKPLVYDINDQKLVYGDRERYFVKDVLKETLAELELKSKTK